MLTTQAAARLTAAEQNVFQQTAALPRLNQNAVCFGLGNTPIEATSTARPERFLECPPCSKQPNDPPGQAGGIPVAPRMETYWIKISTETLGGDRFLVTVHEFRIR